MCCRGWWPIPTASINGLSIGGKRTARGNSPARLPPTLPIPKRGSVMHAKVARGLEAAHRAAGLEDMRAMLQLNRQRQRQLARQGLPANPTDPAASDVPAEEEMGEIHVGDTIIYGSPAPQAPAAGTGDASGGTAPDSPPAASSANSPSLLKKLAVGAALLGTGAGGAIGANALLNPSTPAPAVVKPLTFDPNQYQFQIVGPGVTNVPTPASSTTGT